MSRRVREEEKKTLDILRGYIPEDMMDKVFDVKRNIFFSEETYRVVEKAQIFLSTVIDGAQIALVRYDKKIHICLKTDLFTEGVIAAENEVGDSGLLYGIGILLINSKLIRIRPRISGYQIYDEFFGFTEDREYECQDIFFAFEDYQVYEISEEDIAMEYKEDLDRVLCMFLLRMKEEKYNVGSYQDMFDILTMESSRCMIPMFSTILQTTDTDLVFLQLYRCIEYLYIVQRALYLSKKYRIEQENILRLLDSENIRYPEASSMYDLITAYCSEGIVDEYYEYLVKNFDSHTEGKENKLKKVAGYIYETRCKIVHFKYGQEKLKDSGTLDQSNQILCRVVKEIYQKLDEQVICINERAQLWDKLS